MIITPALEQLLVDHDHIVPQAIGDPAYDTAFKLAAARLMTSGELSAEKYSELASKSTMSTTPDPTKVFGGNIRVKSQSEKYCEKRAVGLHRKSGQTVIDQVNNCEAFTMSEAASARHGVFLKHLARKAGILADGTPEHEKSMLAEIATGRAWAGQLNGEDYSYIADGPRQGVARRQHERWHLHHAD